MELSLLTPSRKLLEKVTVSEVFAPCTRGELNILPEHANMLTEILTGGVRWKDATTGHWNKAVVTTGYLEVYNGNVTILSQVSELESDIDVARAKKAEAKARQKLEEAGLDEGNFRKHEQKLQRALERQRLKS